MGGRSDSFRPMQVCIWVFITAGDPKLAFLLVQAHNIAAECRAAASLQLSTADLEALACEHPHPSVQELHVCVI